MTTTEKLAELVRRCKCGVHLTFNGHRDYYESVADHLDQLGVLDDTDADVRAQMIERDIVVDLQCYPATPIGSYRVLHFDLDAVLDEMLAVVKP